MKFLVFAVLLAGACVAVPQISDLLDFLPETTEGACGTIEGLPDLLKTLSSSIDQTLNSLSKTDGDITNETCDLLQNTLKDSFALLVGLPPTIVSTVNVNSIITLLGTLFNNVGSALP